MIRQGAREWGMPTGFSASRNELVAQAATRLKINPNTSVQELINIKVESANRHRPIYRGSAEEVAWLRHLETAAIREQSRLDELEQAALGTLTAVLLPSPPAAPLPDLVVGFEEFGFQAGPGPQASEASGVSAEASGLDSDGDTPEVKAEMEKHRIRVLTGMLERLDAPDTGIMADLGEESKGEPIVKALMDAATLPSNADEALIGEQDSWRRDIDDEEHRQFLINKEAEDKRYRQFLINQGFLPAPRLRPPQGAEAASSEAGISAGVALLVRNISSVTDGAPPGTHDEPMPEAGQEDQPGADGGAAAAPGVSAGAAEGVGDRATFCLNEMDCPGHTADDDDEDMPTQEMAPPMGEAASHATADVDQKPAEEAPKEAVEGSPDAGQEAAEVQPGGGAAAAPGVSAGAAEAAALPVEVPVAADGDGGIGDDESDAGVDFDPILTAGDRESDSEHEKDSVGHEAIVAVDVFQEAEQSEGIPISECERLDLPMSDEEAALKLDLHKNLIVQGLGFPPEIAADVAKAMVPMLRVKFDCPVWNPVWRECEGVQSGVAARVMELWLSRFNAFISEAEKLSGVSADSFASERVERLWTQCLLLAQQHIALQKRRYHALVMNREALNLPADRDAANKHVFCESSATVKLTKEMLTKETTMTEDMYRNSARARRMYMDNVLGGMTAEEARLIQMLTTAARAEGPRSPTELRVGGPGVSAVAPIAPSASIGPRRSCGHCACLARRPGQNCTATSTRCLRRCTAAKRRSSITWNSAASARVSVKWRARTNRWRWLLKFASCLLMPIFGFIAPPTSSPACG